MVHVKKYPIALAAGIAVAVASQTAVAQTVVRWAAPVTGDFTDPARWTGPVPEGPDYDALVDVSGGAPFFVRLENRAVQTGRLTVASPDAEFYLNAYTLDALRGVDVTAGRFVVGAGARLRTPRLTVGPEADFQLSAPSDVFLDVAALAGVARVRAPLIVERSLHLDDATLRIERHNVRFANGAGLLGSGTVHFPSDNFGGFLAPTGAASLEIGAGVTVTAANAGTIGNSVNFGTLLLSAQYQGGLNFSGSNRGQIRHEGGGGYFNLTGSNEPEGVVLMDRPAGSSPTGSVALRDFANRGLISVRNGGLWVDGSFSNSGTIRLDNSVITLRNTTRTADLRPLEMTGGSVRVAGVLDNRSDTWDLDSSGTLWLADGGRIRGGTITGTPQRFILPNSQGGVLQDVTLDTPVAVPGSAANLNVEDALTVNRELVLSGRSLNARNDVMLGGTGQVSLGYTSFPWPPDTGLLPAYGTTLTVAPELTVRTIERGAVIGSYHPAGPGTHALFVNRGTIVVGADTMLTITGSNWRNEGVIRMEPGAMLSLGGVFRYEDLGNVERNGQVVNFAGDRDITGQTFDLNDSPIGPLDLGSSFFKGGRLVAPGRAVPVRLTSRLRDGLAVQGTTLGLDLDVLDMADVISSGDLMLEGASIRLRGYNSRIWAAGATIAGTGEVVFDAPQVGSPGPGIWAAGVGPGVTVRTGMSSGSFRVVGASMAFTNRGRVLAAGNEIAFEHPVENFHLLEASGAGGAVRFRSGGTNALGGTIAARDGGRLSIEAFQPLHNAGSITVAPGATLDLWTAVNGPTEVQMHGTLRVGGELTATASLERPPRLAEESVLAFTLSGYAPGSAFDRLTIGGTLDADGRVRIDLLSPFKPLPGDRFEILRYDSLMGEFDEFVRGQGAAGLLLTPMYGATATSVLIDALFQGDANLDGQVNLLDFNILAANFGRSGRNWHTGDFDGNGFVNLRDFNILAANFGMSAAGPDLTPQDWYALASTVPEPACGHLAVAAAATALVARARRHTRCRS